MSVAYLNGEFASLDALRVSVLDRGFLFGDGVYEVIPVYGGCLFRLPQHLARLERSLAAVSIRNPCSKAQWSELLQGLVDKNGGGSQKVYLQLTRGVAPRDHAFPEDAIPTVFAMSSPFEPAQQVGIGCRAVTREDIRWQRCDIKTIAFLPNVLARQQAIEAAAEEAILLRDGYVTEGAASNVFVVSNGAIVTPPEGPWLLPGITRELVLELARAAGIRCAEVPVSSHALKGADEIWLTSSTLELVPVVSLDGRCIGTGRPGPVWEQLHALYRDHTVTFASA